MQAISFIIRELTNAEHTLKEQTVGLYTVFHIIGSPLYFFNKILACGSISIIAVSYTHLTLPTIYSV